VIAIPLPWNRRKWSTISFASTLYLHPILDLLTIEVHPVWQAEVRLGLQEALVNAAKHGNKLDPSKTIVVEFQITSTEYSWIITDEGLGFVPQCCCYQSAEDTLPPEESESGRGLCIIYEVFDFVHWDRKGNQLTLSKQVKSYNSKKPTVDRRS
jgi:serine/threonine-protein kinase RsbW